ncbi:MAG: gamma-glutamyltransferase family protein [Proteobacteria bacterium]|nr:gamma-glutamyltransferase family protein [Pseudomonadota bacterium]
MLHTTTATRGMVVAPHHLASQAGLRVLTEGGNAIEAMIAAASTIASVYPHMNALGGDNFWLISAPGSDVVGIDACGGAAAKADIAFYRDQGFDTIPSRGPMAALTVAGAVSGWRRALEMSRQWGGRLPLPRLLEDAEFHAREGFPVTASQHHNTAEKMPELEDVPGFAETYLVDAKAPETGVPFNNPAFAKTLERLGRDGLDDFYRGGLARDIAADLESAGSPVSADDLAGHQALVVTPLEVKLASGTVYNMPPPTQGLASLILLGVFERLGIGQAEGFEFIHGLVEATKCAFRVRDAHVTDPAYMDVRPGDFLTGEALDGMAASVDPARAAPWPEAAPPGDTVWLAAVDGQGRAVSFIQSIYWEFGSGVVLPETGITWQNRGTSFNLDDAALNCLMPGRRPFHTIQPALARLADGRVMAYGAMGGEGQPQTQAMIFTRHVLYGQDLQDAVTAPRWLLGRTWGAETTNLRIENRFEPAAIEALREAGHDVEGVGPFEEFMGHAGAIVHHPPGNIKGGLLEGAADPRSDGSAAGF